MIVMKTLMRVKKLKYWQGKSGKRTLQELSWLCLSYTGRIEYTNQCLSLSWLAYRFLLTLSITQAAWERSFSYLKHIKLRIRCGICQEKVETITLIPCEYCINQWWRTYNWRCRKSLLSLPHIDEELVLSTYHKCFVLLPTSANFL